MEGRWEGGGISRGKNIQVCGICFGSLGAHRLIFPDWLVLELCSCLWYDCIPRLLESICRTISQNVPIQPPSFPPSLLLPSPLLSSFSFSLLQPGKDGTWQVGKLLIKSTDFSPTGLNLGLDSVTYSVSDLGQVASFLWASVSPSV